MLKKYFCSISYLRDKHIVKLKIVDESLAEEVDKRPSLRKKNKQRKRLDFLKLKIQIISDMNF